MNKRLRKKLQTNKEITREITYQEAWNKVSEFVREYIKENGFNSFFIEHYSINKCKLRTIDENGEYVNHLIEK